MADPYSQLPGTMVVDGPQQDPWEQAFQQYRQVLVDLDGDGTPDAVVPVGDQRPPQAFDPDGRPRVPASGGENPYPFPRGAYPPNPNLLERFESDPMGSVVWPAIGGTMNALTATGDAMGPTGMPISMLGRMGAAAVRTPGAALGRGPSQQFQIDRLKEKMAPLAAAEGRASMALPMPRPPAGTPEPQVLNNLLREYGTLQDRAPAVQNALAAKLDEFNRNFAASSNPGVPLLEGTPRARMGYEAAQQGMERQYPPNWRIGQPVPYVRPEANPVRMEAAAREAEALRRGRIDMDMKASAERYANSPAEQAFRTDQQAQSLLGGVRERIGTPPDRALVLRGEPNLPGGAKNTNRGAYERELATLVDILVKERGVSPDDIVAALAARGYAVPPGATFNANVMQQYKGQGGGSAALPMSQAEKVLRDAMHRRIRPAAGGGGQGDAF